MRLVVRCAVESHLDLRLFLRCPNAVTAGLRGQAFNRGYNIQQMLEILTAQNIAVKLCKTCADGRVITPLPLIDGVEIRNAGRAGAMDGGGQSADILNLYAGKALPRQDRLPARKSGANMR